MTARLRPHTLIGDAATLWYPLTAPVAWWAVHLIALAGLTRFTCTQPQHLWTLHAITVGTALGAAAGAFLAWIPLRQLQSDPAEGGDAARRRFLGLLGVIVSLANVLLIVSEGILVVALGSHRCG